MPVPMTPHAKPKPPTRIDCEAQLHFDGRDRLFQAKAYVEPIKGASPRLILFVNRAGALSLQCGGANLVEGFVSEITGPPDDQGMRPATDWRKIAP